MTITKRCLTLAPGT